MTLLLLNGLFPISALAADPGQSEVLIDTPQELDQVEHNPGSESNAAIAQQLNNPNSPLAKLTLEYTTTFFEGDLPNADDQTGNLLLFQPVFPFPLSDDGTINFFARPAFALLMEQPYFDTGDGQFQSKTAFADMGFDLALGKSFKSGFIFVGGVQGTIPTGSSDDLSADQWRLGPEFIAGYINKTGFLAVFPAHQWNISGSNNFSTTTLENFAGLFLEDGLTVLSNPVLSYNHESEDWTIPLNASVRQVVRIGKMPVQLGLSLDYYVNQPDAFGPDWVITLNITPVIPNFIYNWITD